MLTRQFARLCRKSWEERCFIWHREEIKLALFFAPCSDVKIMVVSNPGSVCSTSGQCSGIPATKRPWMVTWLQGAFIATAETWCGLRCRLRALIKETDLTMCVQESRRRRRRTMSLAGTQRVGSNICIYGVDQPCFSSATNSVNLREGELAV